MQPEMAHQYINEFEYSFKRYGKGHLDLAYHAAFPLALTPNLLYLLWANFQRDKAGNPLNIPWIAVADLLLSGLCDEVGHELYEMKSSIRSELLRRLVADSRFTEKRLKEVAHFLVVYIKRQLQRHPNDPDIETFAEAQMWTILAYTQPSKAAKQLALKLRNLVQKRDGIEQIRMASVMETLAEPLLEHGFEPLVVYAQGMADFVRGDMEDASLALSEEARKGKGRIEVAGVELPIPEELPIYPDLSVKDFGSQEDTAEYLVNRWRNHRHQFAEWVIDSWWREALLLTIHKLDIQTSHTERSAFIKTLLNLNDSAEIIIATAELAATGLLKLNKVEESLLESVRQRLVNIFADTELLNSTRPPRRAAAGIALADIGDPRPNVMTIDGMEFCYVPAGLFWMGSDGRDNEKPLHSVDIPYGYWMARYPITNAQFEKFVEDAGYEKEGYWQEARIVELWKDKQVKSLSANEKEPRSAPYQYRAPYNLPNHPVVGVTWYEALAFTYWLTERWSDIGIVMLPSEAEWEKVARGGEMIPVNPIICQTKQLESNSSIQMKSNPLSQQNYPWGNQWEVTNANHKSSAIKHTSMVGSFPAGKTCYGCEEMGGNIWEWTRTLYQAYPYLSNDGRELTDASIDDLRVIRGGSFYSDQERLASYYRGTSSPNLSLESKGFRIVLRLK